MSLDDLPAPADRSKGASRAGSVEDTKKPFSSGYLTATALPEPSLMSPQALAMAPLTLSGMGT